MGHKVHVEEIAGQFVLVPECETYIYAENTYVICPECEDKLAAYPEEFECFIDAQSCAEIFNGNYKP